MKKELVEKDLYIAKKIILNNERYCKGYKKYSVIPFKGTENIKELFSKLKNAKAFFAALLIVTGSGDQILEAIFNGSTDITAFDINILAKYGCQLKIAAVQTLSYEEFIYFYTKGFPLELFNKVSKYLKEDAFYFWNQLFSMFHHYDIHTYLFDTKLHTQGGLIDENSSIYSYEEYEKIKSNLKNVTIQYIDENLFTLFKSKNIDGKKFDLAYFSNIFYYAGKSEKYYAKFLNQKIVPLLKDNGEMILHYLYGAGGKKELDSLQDLLWDNYNQEVIEELEKNITLTKYFVSNSGYGNPAGDKDIALSVKK